MVKSISRRPSGRRGTRTFDALDRNRVVLEALALIDRDGADRFSLRRLADHLRVTPMALYNHVNSKQDLLQEVAARVVAEANYHPTRGNWQTVIRGCFRTLRAACLAHPGAVALVESAEILPEAVFRPMEITLKVLQTAGLSREDALRAYFLLMTFTLGQVKYQMKGWSRGVDHVAAVNDGRIDQSVLPAVTQANSVKSWDFDTFFEFGLKVIIRGLETQFRNS